MDYALLIRIPQYFRNFQRLTEIVRVLVAHGFGDLVQRLNIAPYLAEGLKFMVPRLGTTPVEKLSLGERLRRVCEELGPTFVKLGQFAATRPDLFPPTITEELRTLQDRVAPTPFLDVHEALSKALQNTPGEVFQWIDEAPLAAASIAQVYKAQLQSGERVVLKVQRPGIRRTIETDVDILRGFAALLEEHIPESRVVNPRLFIEEFARRLKHECDFRREARNMRLFAESFSGCTDLVVPRAFEAFSNQTLLVEEYIEGVRADDIEALRSFGIDTSELAERINRIVLRSLFENRFFHADPHPGNILITPSGRVAFIDFGVMGRLDEARLIAVLDLLVAVFSRDPARMLRVLRETQILRRDVNEAALTVELHELLDCYVGESLGSLQVSALFKDIYEILQRHQLKVPSDLLLVGKSLTTLEHLGVLLSPKFQPLQSIYPHLRDSYVKLVADPRVYLRAAREAATEYQRLLREFPQEARLFVRRLSRESLTVETAARDAPEVRRHQNVLINRIVMTAIGLTMLVLSFWSLHSTALAHESARVAAYVLLLLGVLVLFTVWRAVSRSGGLS